MKLIRILFMSLLALVVGQTAAGPSPAEAGQGTAARKPAPPAKKKWKGTASAECRCQDGKCKPLSCAVSGKLSFQDAKSALQFSLEAQARAESGTLKPGSIK